MLAPPVLTASRRASRLPLFPLGRWEHRNTQRRRRWPKATQSSSGEMELEFRSTWFLSLPENTCTKLLVVVRQAWS